MNFIHKSLISLAKLQHMFRIVEIELGTENMIEITLETGVRVQSAILHVCRPLDALLGNMVEEKEEVFHFQS